MNDKINHVSILAEVAECNWLNTGDPVRLRLIINDGIQSEVFLNSYSIVLYYE